MVPGLTKRVTLEVEQNRLLRGFLHLNDEARKAEWMEEQRHFFLRYFGRYYDRVAAYWQRTPDAEAIVPLHRREDPLTQMYWTVYAVVKSATTNEIRAFAAKRDELHRTLCKNDNIRKVVRDYCSVLQLDWTPKRGRPSKLKGGKKAEITHEKYADRRIRRLSRYPLAPRFTVCPRLQATPRTTVHHGRYG